MRCGVLLSGGKDSVYAWWKAMQDHEISCCISLLSLNKESYMFHTPNMRWAYLQAEAAHIPFILHHTAGIKEEELRDLSSAIHHAKHQYQITCIVTGAILSEYQASRIHKICDEHGLVMQSPLWNIDQEIYMQDLLTQGFSVIVSGVASEPFDETWLGRDLDRKALQDLKTFQKKYHITLTGEGGEYESFVCDAPQFSQRIVIEASEQEYKNYRGLFRITHARLEKK
ncbi:MAG: diphthine--ammonia ligase [Methanomicrobiales archaeon]|jgi:ABC transporter with metal-binding/Fe-S-binding domain ATP-binding protein|nr:diphthine--ammonia ligase [Methanomicrobiales archaeon]